MEFLSGLLLTLATLAILGYLVAGLIGSRDRDFKKVRHDLSGALTKYVGSEAKPINQHMVGSTGEVVAHSDEDSRPMRVRIGLEFWPARSKSAEESPLAVGTAVKVAAVDGPVLIVEASTNAAA